MAFQSNAFQNNAFQVISNAVAGLVIKKKNKKRRYIINDREQWLTDYELEALLSQMVDSQPTVEAPAKQKKNLRRQQQLPKAVEHFADISAVYAQMAEIDRATRILRRMAMDRMLEEEDELIILLGMA